MKIVYSTDNYWPRTSGMAVSIDSFKNELGNLGHEVHVFSPDYPGAAETDRMMNNDNIHRFSSYPLLFTKYNREDRMVYPWKKREVFRRLDALKPDLIHVQTEFPMGRITWEYALKNKIPLAITAHTYFEEYITVYFPLIPKKFARYYASTRVTKAYNLADQVIVPTGEFKKIMLSYGVKKPVDVIPTGINKDDFKDACKVKEKSVCPTKNLRAVRAVTKTTPVTELPFTNALQLPMVISR